MKKIYPNIEGRYISKLQGVIVTVSKESIVVETIEEAPEIINVDRQNDKPRGSEFVENVHDGIQFINDVLWGKDKK